ncbi:4-hydroxythreonine-4-phosphate dehydrogenase PdxA [Oceanobacillus kapialis]|uniref:4-hydroxythreonine-4-phosphate dehydrogenase PdxA n=1 Tax=Oceanobacillus kapialis TaxID=481353 RepID=UPI00385112F4
MNKPVIGLLYGEAVGVGPEVLARALQNQKIVDSATWVLIGDERVFLQGAEIVEVTLNYKKVKDIDEVSGDEGSIFLIDTQNTDPSTIQKGVLSTESGKATGDNLVYAVELAKQKKLDGLTYAPMNKDGLFKGGYEFMDDIHLLASLFELESGFGEVNVMDGTWFTRVTSHIPLREVAENITFDSVLDSIHFANNVLTNAGFNNPKIAVAALNPHAGDGGLIGDEEAEVIVPAVEESKKLGINAVGPYPADTIFLRLEKEEFDCILSMYHDQGQTGMKLLGFKKGVTISGGLPITITTAAHGTAFDIAGKAIADSGALEEALKLNVTMLGNKNRVNA